MCDTRHTITTIMPASRRKSNSWMYLLYRAKKNYQLTVNFKLLLLVQRTQTKHTFLAGILAHVVCSVVKNISYFSIQKQKLFQIAWHYPFRRRYVFVERALPYLALIYISLLFHLENTVAFSQRIFRKRMY